MSLLAYNLASASTVLVGALDADALEPVQGASNRGSPGGDPCTVTCSDQVGRLAGAVLLWWVRCGGLTNGIAGCPVRGLASRCGRRGCRGRLGCAARLRRRWVEVGPLGNLDHHLGVKGMHQGRAGVAAHDHVAGQQQPEFGRGFLRQEFADRWPRRPQPPHGGPRPGKHGERAGEPLEVAMEVVGQKLACRGQGVGVHGCAGGAGVSGAVSSRALIVVIAAMPSAMAWCSFTNRATWWSGRPVRNHIPHRGRDGSSRLPRSCSAAPRRSASPLPAGRGRTRTCSLRSKEGASTHSGPPNPRRGT
jgi:hypothetical protein